MSLHADLLSQAEHLAKKERSRPKQASLRRAISSAYYALFHLLISEASQIFVKDDDLWKLLSRVYNHANMMKISMDFASGNWPKTFDPVKSSMPIPQKLREVANAFIKLQQARHDADYNLREQFTRSDAIRHIENAKKAFADWERIRKNDLAKIYLSCFLLWDQWNKGR